MSEAETLLPYYDDYGTDQQRLGRKIYREALSDRRGFRDDQIGIDSEDEIWLDIFQNIGEVAETYTRAQVAAPVVSREDAATALDDLQRMSYNGSISIDGLCKRFISDHKQTIRTLLEAAAKEIT